MTPVFIGSKNRIGFSADKYTTTGYLFVEPQEYDSYSRLYGNKFEMVQLKGNDKGFGYLLNSMLSFAKERKISHYLFCDDDILGFSTRDKKKILADEIYNRLLQEAKNNNAAQVMCSFAGHNWYHKGRHKNYIGAWGVLLNKTSDLLEAGGFNEALPIFNDWDISARLIKAGKLTMCSYDVMFSHKMKSQKGGAEYIYKKQELLDLAKTMLISEYGEDCIKTVRAHDQWEVRFKWSNLLKKYHSPS